MNDYERMRQKHHDGMCGGGCPECYEDQRDDDERRRAYEQPEPTTMEICAMPPDPHKYDGDDSSGGRCVCGEVRYPVGGGEPLPF
jgi:hypothetical protein